MIGKIWLIKLSLSVCLFVFIIGLFNFIIDPYNQYRVKTFYPIYYENDRFQNAGLLKNHDYDTVVLGTSMSQNLVISDLKKALGFDKVIKLGISGGNANQQSLILKSVLSRDKETKNILWDLDTFIFSNNYISSFPSYLYEDNYFKDYRYLVSLKTVYKSLGVLLTAYTKDINSPGFNYDAMYQFMRPNQKFDSLRLLKSFENSNARKIKNIENEKFKVLKYNFDTLFLDLIKKNKDVNFIIYFPPYSILKFKAMKSQNILDDTLKFKRYIFSELIKHNNVKVYDFQDIKSITHNYKNYRDITHYSMDIDTQIIEYIKQNRHLITKNNMDYKVDNLRDQIENYNIDDFYIYLDK
jgi:hypothetical protein